MHQIGQRQRRFRVKQFFFLFQRACNTFLTFFVTDITMSETKDDSNGLEEAQKNQKKAGAAENDPETTGPAENLREEAAEAVDEDSDEKVSV